MRRPWVIPLATAAVTAAFLLSCTKAGREEDVTAPVSVVFSAKDGSTRAGGDLSPGEERITRLLVLLFRPDGTLYASKAASGSSVRMDVNPGTYDVCVVANDPSFSASGLTGRNVSSRTSSFRGESRTAFHMCGARPAQAILASGGVSVPVTRLVSRVRLRSIGYDVSSTAIPLSEPLLVAKVYLTNVWTECGYGNGALSTEGFGATAAVIPDRFAVDGTFGSPWLNYHGLEDLSGVLEGEPEVTVVAPDAGGGVTVGPIEVGIAYGERDALIRSLLLKDYGSSPLSITSGSTASPDVFLYAYPNALTATTEGASRPCTRLVIEGSIGSEKVFYHADLPGMAPNRSYNVDVGIYNYGGTDAEHNYVAPSVSVSCTVSPWEDGSEGTYLFE